MSGGDIKSADLQQATELKRQPKAKRLEICSWAGVRHKVTVSRRYGLAMKTNCGFTWHQTRKYKRYMRKIGVEFESEKKERQDRNELLKESVCGVMATFKTKQEKSPGSIGGFIFKELPYVYVQDIHHLAIDTIDTYHRHNRLTWHDGKIPENEIWIKLGGDHGGGTFKMSFQIGNIENPNSRNNTIVFSLFQAKDYYDNMKYGLDRFIPQVRHLQSATWKEKKMRLFLFGDYEFLSKIMGLIGPNGKHPCLWCTISKDSMQISLLDRGQSRNRLLTTMNTDYAKFMEKGGGDSKKSKMFNSIVHPPLFDIPPKQVCPPYLHLTLGIVLKHHNLMEARFHQLDCKIASLLARQPGQKSRALYDEYIAKLREIMHLEERKTEMKDALDDSDDNTPIAQVRDRADDLKRRIKGIDEQILQKKVDADLGICQDQ